MLVSVTCIRLYLVCRNFYFSAPLLVQTEYALHRKDGLPFEFELGTDAHADRTLERFLMFCRTVFRLYRRLANFGDKQ